MTDKTALLPYAALLTCAAFIAACQQHTTETPVATTPSADTTPTPSPEELEAESSLSLKRGIVTQLDKTFSIRLCAVNNEIPLIEQTEGLLTRIYTELGDKPLYIEAYGERVESASGGRSFVLEELLYATSMNPTAACAAPRGAYELLARGSEPSWSVEVAQDSMLLRQSEAPTEIKFTHIDTSDTEGSVTYRAGIDKHVLELTVTLRPCEDAVSGEFFAYTATAKIDKRTLNGCARVGD